MRFNQFEGTDKMINFKETATKLTIYPYSGTSQGYIEIWK